MRLTFLIALLLLNLQPGYNIREDPHMNKIDRTDRDDRCRSVMPRSKAESI